MALPVRILPKFKAPKVRDPNADENKVITRSLESCVDEMIKYKAYNSKCNSLRARLNTNSGKYRMCAIEKLTGDDIFTYGRDTNLGRLHFTKSASISVRNELLDQVVEILGIDESEIEAVCRTKKVLKVDTEALKLNPHVIELVDKLDDHFHQFRGQVEGGCEIENYMAASIIWIKDHLKHHKLYNKAYNEFKSIFRKASEKGLYPREYGYKGVTICWDDMCQGQSRYNKLKAYLLEVDERMADKFEHELKQLQTGAAEWRPRYGVDDFDLDMMSALDED